MIFVFHSLYVVVHVYWFIYIEPYPHLQDEAYLIMVNNLFTVLLYLVYKYFIKKFCIYVSLVVLKNLHSINSRILANVNLRAVQLSNCKSDYKHRENKCLGQNF